jgi:hypothetical protein
MTSTRVTLRLALGIICGIALVLLPAVFSTGTPTQSNPAWFPAGAAHPPQNLQPALYGLPGSGSAGLSFFMIIVFIFLPSTVFSLLVRRWAERRAREYL